MVALALTILVLGSASLGVALMVYIDISDYFEKRRTKRRVQQFIKNTSTNKKEWIA